ncbi:MAG: putative multidrug-efflux transporter [Pelotomaculum sp. PtaU1.Bin035]|nr:MAG: putative multidrug-efflux transporter [Pelotomaculum sp. PtaU1.Bin035]
MVIKTNLKFNNPFIALKHKNYRYYWLGMCVSLIGTWMQNIAQPWLAYNLTNSPFLLSLIGALQFTPMLFFSLIAGVFIDKHNKKKIILLTQSLSLVITFILALLVWAGQVQYWHILVSATALGMVNTLDMPARQAFVIEIAGKADLMNAIALNSAVFNAARVIGPALAGIIMEYAGIAFCFLFNSISFAAVIISLLLIKPLTAQSKPKKNAKVLTDIKEGLKYIYKHDILLNSILLMAIIGTFAMNFNVLVPVFAKEILKQKETGFGFLMSFMGIGSFIGALFIASISKPGPNKRFFNILPVAIAIFLIITGITRIYLITGLCLALTGFFFISFSSTVNSTMQLNSKDEYRGRVMSIYSLVFAGSTPLGNLYAGAFTDHFGARTGFGACGAIIILLLIPIYIKAFNKRSRRSINT